MANRLRFLSTVSKFIDGLQEAFRGATPPIGFRKVPEAETPPLLIAVNVTGMGHKELAQIAKTNINAVVLDSHGLHPEAFEQTSKPLKGVPLGLVVESGSAETDISTFIELGCDFMIFDLKAPLEIANREKVGKIVHIEPSLEAGLVRVINELPIDAVLIDVDGPRLTIAHVLSCHRLASLLNKPILSSIRALPTTDGLHSLFQAGVNGLLLDRAFPLEALVDLEKAVRSLPRKPRRRTSAVPLLPRPGAVAQPEAEEEEEED